MCVRRPKCGIRKCALRVRSWCVYLIDVGSLPAVAAVMFYLMADTVDNFFLMRENTKKISGQPAYGTELQVTPQEVIDRNKTYVMDDITEFLIKAEPCVPENSTRAGRKRAHKMYDALLLVSTSVANMYNRRILREIYGLYASTQPYRVKSVFLVGRTKDDILQANIEREHHQYRDMLQGQFYDHYHNLTYKTIMGYRWTRLYCKNVKLILKIDDDVFLDVYKFFDFFLPLVPKHKRTVYGFLNYHPRVFRDGKYRVGVEEYAGKNYPNFCSGFFVVPTLDLIDEIYEVSKTVRFFRLEDVFTYGLVRENMVDVQLVHLDVITYDLKSYKDCVNDYRYRCKYMAVEVPPSQLLTTYNQVVKFRKQLGLTSGGAN